jgi:citrate synthase
MVNNEWFKKVSSQAVKTNLIDPSLYKENEIKCGLRNADGTGVIVGFTKIGAVHGYKYKNNIKVPIHGRLYYRDLEINDIIKTLEGNKFEQTMYLLIFGSLPTEDELYEFNRVLAKYRQLPRGFTENMILKNPSSNVMNKLQRSILVLYSNDKDPELMTIDNILKQSIKLIARFPTIISYGYQAKAHYFDHQSLRIHQPQETLGTAENILYMIRDNNQYTALEAETLDLLLLVHAEHGGGNNSAFATHVVSSSGTDTYSAISAAVGALKGPKHGGANKCVQEMVDFIEATLEDINDEGALKLCLENILDRKCFDKTGLIYGMGHAVYTKSDPRAVILKEKAKDLSIEKGQLEKYRMYENIEKLTKQIFKERKGDTFEICANVDLYSGFIYELLNIPNDLYTPIFATARVASWCAHRIEQIISDKKIMRPAYLSIKNEIKE